MGRCFGPLFWRKRPGASPGACYLSSRFMTAARARTQLGSGAWGSNHSRLGPPVQFQGAGWPRRRQVDRASLETRKGCRAGLHIDLFEDCSAFTRVAARTLALSPIVTRYTEGFSHFVTSMTAPVASGWSDLAGWDSHPLESAALSRRTPIAVIRAIGSGPPSVSCIGLLWSPVCATLGAGGLALWSRPGNWRRYCARTW